MTVDGVGYLLTGGTTSRVFRVTANPAPGTFDYTIQEIGTLSYDFTPTDNGSGDIAFDASGVAWLSAGADVYTVNLGGGSLTAVRQTRPLLNGQPSAVQFAGIAFGSDGLLHLANNGPTPTSRYYNYDPATGVLAADRTTGASGARDLASCAFPASIAPNSKLYFAGYFAGRFRRSSISSSKDISYLGPQFESHPRSTRSSSRSSPCCWARASACSTISGPSTFA